MFFPATDPKRRPTLSSNSAGRKKQKIGQRLPSLPKAERLSVDKENWQPKLLKMAKSENLVLNFKPKKQKLSKNMHNRILMEIMLRKIEPWDVSASPQPAVFYTQSQNSPIF